MFVKEMSREECQSVVAAADLARLACCKEGQPYIVPINYALLGNCLYCFSMPGQKIDWMRSNPKVALQIGEFASNRQWKSVVVRGRYRELAQTEGRCDERIHAWSLLEKRPNWWEPGGLTPVPREISGASAHVFFCVEIDEMTGRAACPGEL
ncbi:pyridoxamine 5'-phosphate oxidase family protein [Mesorhizobium plurifarium]|uniref:pyridoxamine 5'-phosphate oxidase family protein n=1 Tax=Sinorhizobium arboris TaxID=76745 RepID=UPI000400E391|nr:pyridoxamine 5'-phosphate oxidase family protein [Sinorhizobium arboris]PST20607.1 pyridoxamine 5'-phosphate oxidase family protein [Mesorhizobium plurifarium]